MTVDTSKTCCAYEIPFHTGTIVFYLGFTAFRGQTQVGDIHLVPTLPHAHEEILGFHIAVNDILGMNIREAMKKLVGKHQDCFEGEPTIAEIKQVLQAGSQEIEHHGFVFAFEYVIVNAWNPDTAGEGSVDIDFGFEKRGLNGIVFKFDGDFFARVDSRC